MEKETRYKSFLNSGKDYEKDYVKLNTIGGNIFKNYHDSKILDEINNSKKNHVLEVGCNTGILLQKIDKKNSIFGIDISKEQAREASKRISALVSSGLQLPFTNNTFDYIIYEDTIHHLPFLEDCFRESFRILKDNGKIIIFDPNPESPIGNIIRFLLKKLNMLDKDEKAIKPRVLEKILYNNGYDSIKLKYGSIIVFPLSGAVIGITILPSWKKLWKILLMIDERLSWNESVISRLFGWKYLLTARKVSK